MSGLHRQRSGTASTNELHCCHAAGRRVPPLLRAGGTTICRVWPFCRKICSLPPAAAAAGGS